MERLRQRADFLAAATGIKVPATAFVLQARKRADDGPVRFGFTVSKKVGNAVERNRVRRRLREIVRLFGPNRMQSRTRLCADRPARGAQAAVRPDRTGLRGGVAAKCTQGAQRQHGIPMTDKKNTILAIVLSALVLIGWQYFFAMPQEKARQEQLQAQQQRRRRARSSRLQAPAQPAPAPAPAGRAAGRAGQVRAAWPSRRARHPRRRAGRLAARADRDRQPAGLDRAQGRPHRRPGAGQVPRDGRSEVAADRTCCRRPAAADPFYAEFGWANAAGARREGAERRHGVDAAGSGALERRPAGDADLGQRRGPRIPPHHRGRRQVSVHRQGRGREQGRGAGHAVSLRADLAPRHAARRSATTSCTKAWSACSATRACRRYTYSDLDDKKTFNFDVTNGWLGIHRQILGRGAAARHQRAHAEGAVLRPACSAPPRPIRPTTCSMRRPSRPARPARPTRACSPAPRKCASSTTTRSSSSSTASTC